MTVSGRAVMDAGWVTYAGDLSEVLGLVLEVLAVVEFE